LLRRALLPCVACAALSAHAFAQGSDVSDEARKHFKAGVSFLQDPDGARYEEAYAEFKAAYAASPSPKILGNLGLCAMKLERDGEAIDAYARYLREAPDVEAEERNQIVQDLQTLQVSVVRVSITVDRPGASIIDRRVAVRGDKVTNVYPVAGKSLEIGVRPGHHEITARLAGFEDATWELDLHGGARESHAFVLKEKLAASPGPAPVLAGPAPEPGGRSALPLVVAGLGGVMIGVGTVTGFMALGKQSDLEKACPGGACPSSFDLEGQRSSTKTLVGVTDAMLIGGVIVAAGGLAWWFLDTPAAKNTAIACTGTGCVGTVRVRFP
jgi:hypothetical protein